MVVQKGYTHVLHTILGVTASCLLHMTEGLQCPPGSH
jgi:hypothetical protein